MRQLLVQVPQGHGNEVIGIARSHRGENLALFAVHDGDAQAETVIVHVSNQEVESLIGELQKLPELRVTLVPQGVMVLKPPASEAPEQVQDVEFRSPIEVFLSGLQSIGSWKGFLSYAVTAGAVVWVGLFTNTSYLLVAAMLIAPFAGPAMNLALGSARGDATLIVRSVARNSPRFWSPLE